MLIHFVAENYMSRPIPLGFVTFGLIQASCFPPFPVYMLSYASQLLAVASHSLYTHESGIDLLI